MGYYINPPNMSKEDFLRKKGTPITASGALASFEAFKGNVNKAYLPVCLVDNGPFTAAGIAYSKDEAMAFIGPSDDDRPKQWFMVSREDLLPYYRED